MSACHNFWMCSPLKKVLNKIEDSYQICIDSYEIHTMATHHGGTGKPSEKDSEPQENDVAIHNEYQADVNDFKNIEPNHHARLRDLANEIEYLCQKVEANEIQPMDTISHLECKLNRLALTLHLSTLLGPLDEVLQ